MTVESCMYSLSIGDKAVGTQVLRTAVTERTTSLEARAQWQGVFGQQSLTQTSQLSTRTGESLRFSEEGDAKGDKHLFEIVFDAQTGLVRATRRSGSQLEKAEVPYLRPYSDPLGLLHTLRHNLSATPLRIPMLGKDVVAERLVDTEVETGLGRRAAHTFVLYPGPSYVYIEVAEPHTILRLLQPTAHGMLEAYLTQVVYEENRLGAPPAATSPPSRTNKRRRGGRRRKRVQP